MNEQEQQNTELEPEVAEALRQNAEAAHFVADLATGTPLEEAVRNHFGQLLAKDAEDEPDGESKGEDQDGQKSDARITYGSLTPPQTDQTENEQSSPAFLSGMRRTSFWPDKFTF